MNSALAHKNGVFTPGVVVYKVTLSVVTSRFTLGSIAARLLRLILCWTDILG
jgi:hypothetical protein